jgi:ribonuclease D
LNRPPANVFDTQICAGFIGLPYPLSLLKLVNELAGVKLGKGLTFSHWDQRPLSPMQLRYAADDVRYLVLVREEIGKRLEAAGHADWAAEECANQCDPKLFTFDPRQQYLRVRGAGSLPPRNLAVLRELTIWRDAAARLNDVPPRAFLKDEIMIELSRNPVKSIDKLDRVRGLPRPVESQHGARIVELTASAMSLPQSELPPVRDIEPSPAEKFRTDSLWAVAQALCAGQSLDVAAVTNRQEINEFYQQFTTPTEAADSNRLLTGWRSQALGEPLLSILRGEAQVQLAWSGGSLRSTALRA